MIKSRHLTAIFSNSTRKILGILTNRGNVPSIQYLQVVPLITEAARGVLNGNPQRSIHA